MRLCLIAGNSARVRAFIASALFCAISLSVGLSAAPHLHEWLHDIDHQANHECAVTHVSSGSWDQTACDPALTAPVPAPSVTVLPIERVLRLGQSLDFSLLEHAPPALS